MARCTYTVDRLSLTGDDVYGPRICNQPFVDYAWYEHGFNSDYWQGGWGYDDCCNVTKPLGRVFNSIWLLGYSAPDPADESWSAPILNWAPRYVREQFLRYDDLRARCAEGSAFARTTGCQWTRSFSEWKCQQWKSETKRSCRSWHWLVRWLCLAFAEIVSWFCVLWGWVSTAFCALWFGTVGGGQNVTLYLKYFYTLDSSLTRDVVIRAGTLLHEARHIGEKPHDAEFPAGSTFGSGGGADSSWGYEGGWMFHAYYFWWFSVVGARTTVALRQSARSYGNVIIANAFAQHPGFMIP